MKMKIEIRKNLKRILVILLEMLVTRAIAVLVAGRDDYADGVVDTDDDDSGGGDNDVEADFDSDTDGGIRGRL